ncbi:MAG: ATP phosphoribosyltransferase regulatory subunit [Candidatus Natronoplasma sp.]
MKKDIFSESGRLDSVATEIRDVFKNWSYEEIFLPSIAEHTEELRKGLKTTYDNQFYVVKPDITSQISANFKGDVPTRKFYISEILDGIDSTLQAGIEYICDDPLRNKVETLSVAISVLERLNIEDFYIDIGSLQIWREYMEEVKQYEDEIFRALKRRNLSLIDDLSIPEKKKDELWELLNIRGQQCGFNKIDKLLKIVDDERVYADLGTVRPLTYYDDIIFEIYSSRVGYPIGGGGEYTVNGVHGCGFALDLGLVSDIYEEGNDDESFKIDGDLKTSYSKALKLVKDGKRVVLE